MIQPLLIGCGVLIGLALLFYGARFAAIMVGNHLSDDPTLEP